MLAFICILGRQLTNLLYFVSSGYMSPEYAVHGFFSTKSDVFSFGVILLEIVSGRKSTTFCQSDSSLNLLGYVSDHIRLCS